MLSCPPPSMLRLRGGSAWPTSMDSVSPWGTTTEAAGDVCGSDANGTGSMVPRAAVVASHRGLAVIPEEPEDVEAMEDVQVDVARQHREDEYKERQQQGGSSGQHALPLANVHATTTTMTSTVSTTSITTTTITTECEGRAMPIDTLLDVNDDDEEEDNDEVVSERRIVLDMLVGASCRSKRSIVAGTTVAARFPPKHGRSGDSSNSSGTDGSDISDDADDMAVLSAYATAGRLVDGGEDAHFMTSTARHSCFGVADGVGGWNTLGINPAVFAWDLMENARAVAEGQDEPMPWDVLHEAYSMTSAKGDDVAGSSTACIVTFDKFTGTLHSANLGDSGFVLFRFTPKQQEDTSVAVAVPQDSDSESDDDNADSDAVNSTDGDGSGDEEVVIHGGPADEQEVSDLTQALRFLPIFESEEKQHYFNAPYQLAVLPSKVPESQRHFFMADTPSDAYHSTFDALQPGDIIVMGTDGLFDNVFIEELAAVLERELGALFEEGGMDCGESSMEHDEDEVVDIGGGRNANSSDSGKSDASASGIGGKIANAVFAAPTTAWLETLRVRVQRAADAMVHEAAKLARSNRISPFGKAAMQHGWVEYTGGKVDDITVVTALVVAREYRDDEATEDD